MAAATLYKRFLQGIGLVPKSSSTNAVLGDLEVLSSTNRLMFFGASNDAITSDAVTATLTNKTLSGNTATNLISGSGTFTFNTTGTITAPNATDTLVGKATTDVLTNKTLTGNTAVNLISGSGTFVLNTTGTITAPNATDTLVGKATTDTLTNKSIAAGTNTISGLTNTNLSGSAAITNANLAAMAANTVKANITGGSATPTDVGFVSTNTASTGVFRDGSGNFAAGTITAALSGNATTATTATNLAGGAGGSIPYQSAANTTAMLANGTAGQILTSNGTTLAPTFNGPVVLSAVNVTVSGTLSGSDNVMKFASTTVDTNSAYNTTTGLYTVPVAGNYRVSGQVGFTGTYAANTNSTVSIYKNGSAVVYGVNYAAAVTTTALVPQVGAIISCAVNDTIGLYGSTNATSPGFVGANNNTLAIERIN